MLLIHCGLFSYSIDVYLPQNMAMPHTAIINMHHMIHARDTHYFTADRVAHPASLPLFSSSAPQHDGMASRAQPRPLPAQV